MESKKRPTCNEMMWNRDRKEGRVLGRKKEERTRATASLEAMIMMSAQDTTPGHEFSRASFTWSTTSNDLREFMLERASFSPTMLGVSSSSMEASHPWTIMHHQINKSNKNTHKITIYKKKQKTIFHVHSQNSHGTESA